MNLTGLLSQIAHGQYEHDPDNSQLVDFRFYFEDKVIVVTTNGNVEEWDQYGDNFVRNLT